jgi:hypothetical protein
MRLASGKSYPLSAIFDAKCCIIVPDLQRDYCWGKVKGKDGTTLALTFCQYLLSLWRDKAAGTVSLGLIYAYEHPKDSGLIHIADGQQRLTTIYLVLLAIRKRSPHLSRVHRFIEKGKREARLQFEIRDTTRYFIAGLLNHLDTTTLTAKEIKAANWFRQSYEHDPSVESMCMALGDIASKIKDLSDDDLEAFGDFILGTESQGIRFVYFDVQDRALGEKLYVIINSRGAPMEESEHVKPLLLGHLPEEQQQEWAETWEDWQDFFWQQRNKEKEPSGDAGFDEFLEWHMHIKQRNDKGNVYSFYSIKADAAETTLIALRSRFKAVERLTRHLADPCFQSIFAAIRLKEVKRLRDFDIKDNKLVVYPLLVAIEEASVPLLPLLRSLRRNRFDQQGKKWQHRQPNAIDWTELLNGNLPPVTHPASWRNQEETIKAWLRKEVESAADRIDEWEDQDDLQGDLWPLIRALCPTAVTADEVVTQLQRKPAPTVFEELQSAFERFNALQSNNFFDVLKVCWGSHPIGKLYQVNHWNDTGKYGINFEEGNVGHLHQTAFWLLLGAADLAEAMRQEVASYFITTWPTEHDNCRKTLTLWLLLKALLANGPLDLSKSDYLAACNQMRHNKLLPDLDGKLANLYCGKAAMRSTWWHGTSETPRFHNPLFSLVDLSEDWQKWLQTLPRTPLEVANDEVLDAHERQLREAVKTFFGDRADEMLEAFVAHIDGK